MGYSFRIVLAFIYLAVNLACLTVLVRKGYQRAWPAFLAFQAMTCWQAGARMGLSDAASWRRIWAPGEMLLLAATAAAVGESLWKSLRALGRHRILTFPMLILGAYFIATWAVDLPAGDWYTKFLGIRVQFFLTAAIVSSFSIWGMLCFGRHWPRAERMHSCMFSILMAAHVVVVDWSRWQWSNLEYRALQMICACGWIINANLLDEDLALLARTALRAASPRTADQPAFPHALPPVHLEIPVPQLRVDRAGFGARGRSSAQTEIRAPRSMPPWQN